MERSSELNARYIHGLTQLVRQLSSESTVTSGPNQINKTIIIFFYISNLKVRHF